MHRARNPLTPPPRRRAWWCVGLASGWLAACAPTGEDTAPLEVVLVDEDGDGWPLPLDCDDALVGVHPGAAERCNGSDDDCDGQVDDHPADGVWGWLDMDRDGWGDPATRDLWCGDFEDEPLPWVTNDGDCDDGDRRVHPFTLETCEEPADENCDGSTNDAGAQGCVPWYEDLDGDGVGVERSACLCEAEGNYRAPVDGDCDDEDSSKVEGCGLSGARTLGAGESAIVGAAAGDSAGTSLARAGDPDGDGWPDLLVGAPEDRARPSWVLLRGPFDGDKDLRAPSATFNETILNTAPLLTMAGGVDLDGDGADELVLGAYGTVPEGAWTGLVYILGGGDSGTVDLSYADARFDSARTTSRHTIRVAVSPDTDGDGIGDLIIGGTWNNSVWLFSGPVEGAFTPTSAACSIQGVIGEMGSAVAAAGDVDGDGLGDLLAGAPLHGTSAEGAVLLVSGGTTGSVGAEDATAVLWGPVPRSVAGATVAGPGDIDGDGYDDVLVGGPTDVDGAVQAGSVWLVRGPLAGAISLFDADARIDGGAAFDASYSIEQAGDLDGDGAADLAIGSPGDDTKADGAGAVFVFFGPVQGTARNTDGDLRLYGAAASDAAGMVLTGAGDLDMDGFDDLVLGVPGMDLGGRDAGGAFVVRGGAR
ncbi:MAG: integrin alpha [Myxococcota bacterium]